MHLSGEERFAEPQSLLWHSLTDTSFIAKTIPELQRVDQCEAELLVCRIKPGFSFLSGTLELTIEIVDRQPPRSAGMRVRGKGIGTAVVVETAFQLGSESGETMINWTGEITQRGGLLKSVSQALLEAAAHKVITRAWTNVRRELAACQSD
jgi:carbon monoxide dehydrogenase subunit G